MSKFAQPHRVNMQALAQDGQTLIGVTALQKMERVTFDLSGFLPDSTVNWQARAEFRDGGNGSTNMWLHLQADATLPLTCQRCLTSALTPLAIDQWYRFVDSEDIAMAEDDESEEDLLVTAPHFDLVALLEDELLMAIPLVPMHESCPTSLQLSSGTLESGEQEGAVFNDHSTELAGKPNPFAVLAGLKKQVP